MDKQRSARARVGEGQISSWESECMAVEEVILDPQKFIEK